MTELFTAPLKVDRVALVTQPGEDPQYSPFGYVITEDGTTYALQYRFYHGIILACLFPEICKEAGFEHPVTPHQYNGVFEYQRFELENKEKFGAIRISFGTFGAEYNIYKSPQPATDEQIAAVMAIGKVFGLKAQSMVVAEWRDTTFGKLPEELKVDERDPEERENV